MKRIAVISGGGALGSFTVGKLLKVKPDYDVVIGTSTGALMAPLVALGYFERLSGAYLDVRKEDLFEHCPFKDNGHLRKWNALQRIIRSELTLGENTNQLKLIRKMFTQDDFNTLRRLGKEVVVVVKNISCYNIRPEYISSNDYDYDKFCLFMWASSSVPLVTSVINIDGYIYADGGITENVGLKHIFTYGMSSVDVFLHSVEMINPDCSESKITGFFHHCMRIFKIMREEIKHDDIETALEINRLMPLQLKNDIKLHYMPQVMKGEDGMDFRKESQERRHEIGYNDKF